MKIIVNKTIQLNDENKNKLYLFITALLIYITWKNYFVSMQCFSAFFLGIRVLLATITALHQYEVL